MSLPATARTLARQPWTVRGAGQSQPLRPHLDRAVTLLRQAYGELNREAAASEPISETASWLLDHRRVVESHVADVRENLPHRYRALPRAVEGPLAAYPRAYVLAVTLVRESGEVLTPASVLEAVQAFQDEAPLRLGELWALETLLRLVLVETLAKAAHAALDPHADAATVRRVLTTLRTLSVAPWKEFVEQASVVERELRRDPSGIYPQMDFVTRDRYRHAVESVAQSALRHEHELAALAVGLAEQADAADARQRHVGHYLAGKGLPRLRALAGFRPTLLGRVHDALLSGPLAIYFGGLALALAFVLAVFTALFPDTAAALPWWGWALLLLVASEPALAILNAVVPLLVRPRTLPRLDFSEGIPPDCHTMVVVPTLLLSPKNVQQLLEDLEVRYLANPDPQLSFALLTDFPDKKATRPEQANPAPTSQQAELLDQCAAGINQLNRRHRARHGDAQGRDPFFLFHRPRQWNQQESAWMGAERKRGKLMHFNALLRGEADHFDTKLGDLSVLPHVRFVITLDTDTQLPRGTAQQLVGTMAHPLNRPVIDPRTNLVVDGYSILQPRVGVSVSSAAKSTMARLFSGQTGIDPYTTAVSDVYQDLFGEGSFTGKGIYDVAAFETVMHRRFPDNALLSHDLIEGVHARAGLATDIEVIDDYPTHYQAYSRRKHRWIRGDWQLLYWLGPRVPDYHGRWAPNPLPLLARWKIFDNLRRSVVEVGTLALLLAGWFVLPGNAEAWTGVVAGLLVLPGYVSLALALPRVPPLRMWRPYWRDVGLNFLSAHTNALLSLIFLPQQAALVTDAVVRALVRRFVTRSLLLEWESMAQVESLSLGGGTDRLANAFLWVGPALGLLAGSWLDALNGTEVAWALGVAGLWLLSPAAAAWLDMPLPQPDTLDEDDRTLLRAVALRTWRYFDEFAEEGGQGIAPDNVQETPPAIAHRTSPTNVGLQLTAEAVAADFGYLTLTEAAERLGRTLHALEKMPKQRGHMLNWADTRTLQPLEPLYVSSVDSGNLAGCLLAVGQTCREWARQPIAVQDALHGLQDHLALFAGALPPEAHTEQLSLAILALRSALASTPAHLFLWQEVLHHTRTALGRMAAEWERSAAVLPEQAAADAALWLARLQRRLDAVQDELWVNAPWLRPEFDVQIRLRPVTPATRDLFALLASVPTYSALADHYTEVVQSLDAMLGTGTDLPPGMAEVLQGLRDMLAGAGERARLRVARWQLLADRCRRLVVAMDFAFLLDPARKLLVTGYDVAAGKTDASCYDLLASEARMGAFIAIAKGDAPQESWFLLGRTLTSYAGERVLLSWTGTMFEYLMPALLMRLYEGTLLAHSLRSVVACQRRYAREHAVPWGISESAYALQDAQGHYQYRAFGVPALALKRGMNRDLVVAPYATLLALLTEPRAAAENLRSLVDRGWLGAHGLYEAVDYTPDRLAPGEPASVVRAYMVHHQGMGLLAIANALHGSRMQDRFHADPMVQATELLLQERLPAAALAQPPKAVVPETTPAEV